MTRLQSLAVAALGIAMVAAGLVAGSGHGEGLQALGFDGVSTVEGLLYLALAGTIAQRSRIAGLLACAMILLDAGLRLLAESGIANPVSLALLSVRILVVAILLPAPAARPARIDASAACVVPPLDVTRSRSTSGGSCEARASSEAPTNVPTARRCACCGVRPISTPAWTMASRKKKT
ncbi:MAG: hypothetical protein NVS9B10_14370 [Nevskia sp.]